MKAFASFKNEVWCMDFVFVDELAKKLIAVKYSLVHQDFYDRPVDAKGMKIKDSKETVRAFSTIIMKKKHPEKVWVDIGQCFL